MIIKYKEFVTENKSGVKPEDYGIYEYEWVNGKLNCYQDVDLEKKNLKKLPFNFGEIDGSFLCSRNQISNLIGAPEKVGRNFWCSDNEITSLKHCPRIVSNDFSVNNNNLDNLDYCPSSVGGRFYCSENDLKSIEDYPLCDIKGLISNVSNFRKVLNIFQSNQELFLPLLNDKVKFHQMVMRIDPSLIQYYTTIQPPSKRTIL